MEGSSENSTEPYSDDPIDCETARKDFTHYSLLPALAIILVLSLLKRRIHKRSQCHGRLGLVIPVNFLKDEHNRWAIACAFGSVANHCFQLFTSDFNVKLSSNPWLSVLSTLLTVFEVGVVDLPLFACLTTDFRLVGAVLGFLYSLVKLIVEVSITFQCPSDDDFSVLPDYAFYQSLPTFLCILCLVIKFLHAATIEIRSTFCSSQHGFTFQKLIEETQATKGQFVKNDHLLFVRRLFQQEETNVYTRKERNRPVIVRILHWFYRPLPHFTFSTQIVSTLVVAVIIIYNIAFLISIFLISLLALVSNYVTDGRVKSMLELYINFIAWPPLILALLASFILILHLLSSHRLHILSIYHGKKVFLPPEIPTPANLVTCSLRFSGYQIAYISWGFLIIYILTLILDISVIFLHIYSPSLFPDGFFAAIEKPVLSILPILVFAIFVSLSLSLLGRFVFKDSSYPNISKITIDNPQLYLIFAYFFFFFNIIMGIGSCFLRILKGIVLGVVFLSRIDRSGMVQGFYSWDTGYISYLGFLLVHTTHKNPILLTFCQIMHDAMCTDISNLLPSIMSNPDDNYYCKLRARNRWFLTVMLIRNPSLRKYRKVVHDKRESSLDLTTLDFSNMSYVQDKNSSPV